MAKGTTPIERKAIAIVDRNSAAQDKLIAALTREILAILAQLFAEEQRELDIAPTRTEPTAPPPVSTGTGKPTLPSPPKTRAQQARPRSSSKSKSYVDPLKLDLPKRAEPAKPPEPVISKKDAYTGDAMARREKAVKKIASLVTRAETRSANLIQAQNDALTRLTGDTPAPAQTGYTGERPRKVEPEEEWKRPVFEFVEAARQGRGADEAAKLAAERVEVAVIDDLNVAQREGNKDWMERNLGKVTGYRRVVHPELSEGGSCGLCLVAATRIYYTDRLHPIHARCKCGIVPIFNENWGDIGDAMNAQDIDEFNARFYAEGGSNRSEDLKKVRYEVVNHDELGPQFKVKKAASSRQMTVEKLAERGGMKKGGKRRKRAEQPQVIDDQTKNLLADIETAARAAKKSGASDEQVNALLAKFQASIEAAKKAS